MPVEDARSETRHVSSSHTTKHPPLGCPSLVSARNGTRQLSHSAHYSDHHTMVRSRHVCCPTRTLSASLVALQARQVVGVGVPVRLARQPALRARARLAARGLLPRRQSPTLPPHHDPHARLAPLHVAQGPLLLRTAPCS
eukprot:451317-Rhodomonas_salina.1